VILSTEDQTEVTQITELDFPKFQLKVRRQACLDAAVSVRGRFLVQELVYVYIFLPNLSILYFKEIEFETGQEEVTLIYENKRRVPVGTMEFRAVMRSGSYAGLDLGASATIEVVSGDKVEQNIYVHPEDKDIKKSKNFFTPYRNDDDIDSDEELSSGDEGS
jgi:hypothetical protein